MDHGYRKDFVVNGLDLGHFHGYSSCNSGSLKVTEQKNWLSVAAAQGSCVRTAPGWKNNEKSWNWSHSPFC